MISDLASLRAAVADYLNREDLSSAQLDQFIDNGRRAAAVFLTREQEQSAILTLDAQLEAATPADFLAARALFLSSGISIPERPSIFTTPEEPGYRILQGVVAIIGAGAVVVPGSQVELIYYGYPSQLVAPGDSNAFLLRNADLWMWAACEDGARFLESEAMLATAEKAKEQIGARAASLAKSGRQWGGPRSMTVRR